MALMEVNDLRVTYRTTLGDAQAVDCVSFVLQEGESLGLVGESGCGKTTAAKAILRLLPSNGAITGGEICFQGQDLVQLREEELRKVRWNLPGTGKRGAIRIIYYWSPPDTIFMLFPYKKSEQEELTRDQLKILRRMIKELLS